MLRPEDLVVECDGRAEVRLRPGKLAERQVGTADPLADRGLDLRPALEVAPDEGGRAIEHLEYREPVAQRVEVGRGLGDHLAQEIVDGRKIGALLHRLTPLPGHPGEPGGDRQQEQPRERGRQRVAAAPHPGAGRRSDRPRGDRLARQPAREVIGQGLGAGVAPLGLLFQALQADDLQVARDLRVALRRRLGRTCADLVEDLDVSTAGVGGLAGQQGVQDCAQAIDVGGRREAPLHARRLLRRHVGRSPHDGARLRQVAVALDAPGQAEVGHVRLAVLVDQDVGRLQVAMEDAALMGVVHRLGDGRDQPGRGADVAAEVVAPLVEAGARRSASC